MIRYGKVNVVNFSQFFWNFFLLISRVRIGVYRKWAAFEKYLSQQLKKVQAVALHNSEKDLQSTFLIVTY